MYLDRVYIKNFRSIKEEEITFKPGKNVIIGRNNAGKSNIIKAIEVIFSESSPDYSKTDNINIDDFHYSNSKKQADEIVIICDIKLNDNEKISIELFRDDYLKTKSINLGDIEKITINEVRKILDCDDSNTKWINYRNTNLTDLSNQLLPTDVFTFVFVARRSDEGIEKKLRLLYRHKKNEFIEWNISFVNNIRNNLIASAVIPSFRDPSSQLKITKWTWYGKLLKTIIEDKTTEKTKEDLVRTHENYSTIANTIFQDVMSEINSAQFKIPFGNFELSMQFNHEREELYKSTQLYLDDGYKALLTEKGSGIQSTVIICLFNYYMSRIYTKGSALMCLEEPEIYLHPHAQRSISLILDDFVKPSNRQVIITTHSPYFINNVGTDVNIIHINKMENKSIINYISIKKGFNRIVVDMNSNELFFSDKVVICEGLDHYIIKIIADKYYHGTLDNNNISIIQAQSKDAIPDLVKLVLKIGIKCFIISDFDFLLRDPNDDYKEYTNENKNHKSLESIHVNFYKQFDNVDEKQLSLQQRITLLRNELRKIQPQFFYTGSKLSDLGNEPINDLFEKTSILIQDLNAKGIGLLKGTIENYIKDKRFLNDKHKLDLESIYKINNAIYKDDVDINEIIDTEEIKQILIKIIDG